LFSDFSKQKEQYRNSADILLETSNLASQFYNIQEYSNLFLVQKETYYLNIYQTEIDSFQQKLAQIVLFLQHKDENSYLTDISLLLYEKKVILKRLQQLFSNKKDVHYLYQKIEEKIEEKIPKDTLQIIETTTTIFQDTVWQKPKNFNQRLRDAFRSSKKRGREIATVNTLITTDTLTYKLVVAATTPLIDSLYSLTKQYQYQYATKIERIEIELYALLSADRYISKEITALLLQLHEDMLLNVIALGEEYERNAQHALAGAVFVGIIALLLITMFIIFILKNVQRIRKAHEALSLEKQKTEELMEHRHQLLLAISHDIKTPLNALMGYLELWENQPLSSTQLRELNIMQYSGKYILSLLNNLLEFTRLEQKKSQIIQDNIEIVPFFMEIMEMFQPLCKEKNNLLTYHINVNKNPQVLIDSLKLKQIIVNLISNAVKYTSNGKINLFVEEICEPNIMLKITISDTGNGISKEKLDTLFEPFTRVAKNSAGIEGSGLGLFVVKGLIDILSGNIEIETEENRGTSVIFHIPCENVLENTQSVNLHRNPLIVWVIEDDAVQLQIIVSMLQKLGHTAITSTNKKTFDEIVETSHAASLQGINLIFTDLEMGDLNGCEVLHTVKSLHDVPIICVSGNNTTSNTELMQLGFDDFLEKPFTLNQLEKIIDAVHKKKAGSFSNLFSLQILNEMFDNDKDAITALLNTFTLSLPSDIQKIERALEEKNLFLIQQIAHRILPFCKQIKAHKVVPILEKIELSKQSSHISFIDFQTDIVLLIMNLKKLLSEIHITLKE